MLNISKLCLEMPRPALQQVTCALPTPTDRCGSALRFCLASTQAHWGGGEALLWSLSRQLQVAGHGVQWITRRNSDLATKLQAEGTQPLHLTHGRGLNPRDWIATCRRMRRWAPDVVILNDAHAVPLAGSAAWFCKSPRPIRLAYKHTVFPLRSRLKYRLLSDRMVCVSHAARQVMIDGGLPKEFTSVIYGGCELPPATSDYSQSVRVELGLDDSTPLIAAVGNLQACKGHQDLLHAVALIPRAERAFQVVIAGEGPERERLHRKIRELELQDSVQLLGYRDDADQLLRQADLVVHPSHAEGLSLVLIQAQMLGKPIVATAVGGAAEVLGYEPHSQRKPCTSWIAEPRDPHSLARQLVVALDSIRSPAVDYYSCMRETMARTERLFSIENNARELAELAGDLAAQRRAA